MKFWRLIETSDEYFAYYMKHLNNVDIINIPGKKLLALAKIE
jgi:hypothetical protein